MNEMAILTNMLSAEEALPALRFVADPTRRGRLRPTPRLSGTQPVKAPLAPLNVEESFLFSQSECAAFNLPPAPPRHWEGRSWHLTRLVSASRSCALPWSTSPQFAGLSGPLLRAKRGHWGPGKERAGEAALATS